MNGLSNQEIENRKKELNTKYYGNNSHTPENLLRPMTKEDSQELDELSFRGWVNSCLIYGMFSYLTEQGLQKYDLCFRSSTLTLYRIKLERALAIIEEQKERFKTAKVNHNVYTDSEGCTYNSCIW